MALDADTLLDRLHLKEQITRWRLLAILSLIIAGIVFFQTLGGKHTSSIVKQDYIARLSIEGVIFDDSKRDELIESLIEDDYAKAVFLKIDSPGGSAIGGEELYLQLRRLAEKKPVVAIMRNMATSAGYMTALGADKIYARVGTITGSIGVIIQTAEFTDLAQKIGVTPIIVKSGPLKGNPSPLEEITPGGREALQAVIDDFHDVFIQMVADRRNLPLNTVRSIADGRVYSGQQAHKLKLIDAIGGEEEALAWLEEEKGVNKGLRVLDKEPKKDDLEFIERFANSLSEKITPNSISGLDGLAAIWHPNMQIQ